MELVVIESPYAGDVERNVDYARACMHDCLMRGEAPYASHLLYTQPGVLDDDIPDERELGIRAGFCWAEVAAKRVVYTDLGISRGMKRGVHAALGMGQEVEYRKLGGGWYVGSFEFPCECGHCGDRLERENAVISVSGETWQDAPVPMHTDCFVAWSNEQ